ncbi:MAG: sulfatase-like hydrolase/transferase [Balneolaceae bacterium]
MTLSPLTARPASQQKPERVVLFIIDGLHTDAPARLKMPNFTELTRKGALIEKTTVIMPGHPTHGGYAEVHSSSFPNPVMMTGTVFLTPDQRMLQHSFDNSAFIANTLSYRSITDGYRFVVQRSGPDEFSVDKAVDILRGNDPEFTRIHLQMTGDAGYQVYSAENSPPYRHNIWHEVSPYVQAAEEADRQLGRFISALKEMGKWEGTLLVVTSDHGQTESGWHPLLPEDSWLHPTVFHGPGIRQGHTTEWADQTDLAPTIADIMQVEIPNEDGGGGVVLESVRQTGTGSSGTSPSRLYKLNSVIARYLRAEAELLLNSAERPWLNSYAMIAERNFYGLDRIMDWNELDSVDALIRHNRKIAEGMEKQLEEPDRK